MIRQTVLPFKLERTDETLTAHGGLALVAEYNHGLGLRILADHHLPGPGSNRGYTPSVFVDTLVLMLQAGGRTLEDLRALEREATLLSLLDRDVLPDPDTVGDWLRRMGDPQTGQAGLVGLGQVRDALTTRLLRRDGVTEYTLDVDATLIEAEKREAQWSYQGVQGYMPLLGFLFETPICLVDEFRHGAENFHKELKAGFGLERMPCGDVGANAVFFRLGVLAYNLFIGFRRLACPAAWAAHTIATVRWRLIQVAGRIVRHAGQVVLRLAVDAATLGRFRGIRQQCWALREGT